jgi:two-component system phosphate regulon sensor histidine kinase PhoR
VKRKKRLLWQLYPSYLLITLVALVAAIWFASRTLKQVFLEQNASDLEARARLLEQQILEYLSPLDQKGIDRLCKKSGGLATTRITVILPSGRVIGDSAEDPAKMDNHIDRPEVIQALTGHIGVSTRFSATLQKNLMYVGVPLKRDPNIIGVVRASVPLTPIDEAIKGIQMKIAVGGLLIAILAAILSLLVSRRISRPIEEIRRGAESFARGDFRHRLPTFNSEEIGGLSETMNQMAVELHERINTIMRQRNELEAVLSSMVEGVIAADMEERVISMNHAAAQIFDCDPSEAQGRSIQEVVRNTALHRFVTNALSSKESIEKDIVLYSDGERILNSHGTILRDSDGNRVGGLIVLNDVTRLRRLESMRRDFVANVSHEIKTPITAIKGFVETLRDGAMKNPEDAERFLGIVEKHVDRLDAIIEDLLNLSRIEQEIERDEIILHEGHIRDLLQAVIQLCEAKAAPKNIRIELSCDEDLKANIDAPLLEHAVVNLLDNAIKYSDEGSTVWVESTQADGEIIISVRDQGRGIAKEHLPRVFERFYRVDKARSRALGGTGLGLAIVKHITEAHGGHVDVKSLLGKGSTFSLHLPAIASGD